MDGTGRSLSDEALDRQLEAALDVEPSPEFLARVRTRIASEPPAVAWLPSFPLRACVSAAGIVVVALAFAIWRAPGVDQSIAPSNLPVLGAATAVPAVENADDISTRGARSLETAQPVAQHRRADTSDAVDAGGMVPLRLSPVVISDGERRAFAMFVTAVNEGRVPTEADGEAAADDSIVFTAFTIEPLVIDPLPPLARVELQGEGQW